MASKEFILQFIRTGNDNKCLSILDCYSTYKLGKVQKGVTFQQKKEWFISMFINETDEHIINRLQHKIQHPKKKKEHKKLTQIYKGNILQENLATIELLQDKRKHENVYERVQDLRAILFKQYNCRKRWNYKELRRIILNGAILSDLKINSFLKIRLPHDKPDGIFSYGINFEVTLESVLKYLMEQAFIYDYKRKQTKEIKKYRTSPTNSQVSGKAYPLIIRPR